MLVEHGQGLIEAVRNRFAGRRQFYLLCEQLLHTVAILQWDIQKLLMQLGQLLLGAEKLL